MRPCCNILEHVEIIIHKIHLRPWHCPKGYICLYESFFLEDRLWFPLPELLVTYCHECKLTISQLTAKSICHIVSILILGVEANSGLTTASLKRFFR